MTNGMRAESALTWLPEMDEVVGKVNIALTPITNCGKDLQPLVRVTPGENGTLLVWNHVDNAKSARFEPEATSVGCKSSRRASQTSTSTNALVLNAQELAGLLSVSTRHVERMDAAGKLPRPLRIGRSKRWSRTEIEAWMAAGCPERSRWEILRKDNAKKR